MKGISTARLLTALSLFFVPAVGVAFTPLAPALELAFVGLIPAAVGLLHGRRLALMAALVTAFVVAIVELANPHPIASVIVMVLIGLAMGASAIRGWQTIASVIFTWPAVLLVGAPLELPGLGTFGAAPWVALIAASVALVSGLWTVLVGYLLLLDLPPSPVQPLDHVTATVYGLALAVLLGATTVAAELFADSAWGHNSMAGWALLTILVVARPSYSETWHRVVNRSLGTIAGGLGALALALVIPVEWLLTVIGLVALAAAILLQLKRSSYAFYSVALTASIVLLNSRGHSVLAVDIERVGFTVAGAVLTAAVVTILQVSLSRAHTRRHDNAPIG
ncbi:MAG: FUSC family protein [Leifsonia flava]